MAVDMWVQARSAAATFQHVRVQSSDQIIIARLAREKTEPFSVGATNQVSR